jgi:hypothetical protein
MKPLVATSGQLVYALIAESGDLFALSHSTLSLTESFRMRLPAALFCHISQFSNDKLVLTSPTGRVFLISNAETQFAVETFSIPEPRLSVAHQDFFVSITETSAAFLCRFSGDTVSIWGDQSVPPIDAAFVSIGEKLSVVVSTSEGFLIGDVCEQSYVRRLEGFPGLKKLVCVGGSFFGISVDGDQVLRVDLDDDLTIQKTTAIANGREINDLATVTDQTVIGCSATEVFAFVEGQLQLFDLTKKQVDGCRSVLTFPGQSIFVGICANGNMVVCRASEVGTKEPHVQKKLHTVEIRSFCSGDEFSFLTLDVTGNAVLWENVPDWWDAPYHLKLFQDDDTA